MGRDEQLLQEAEIEMNAWSVRKVPDDDLDIYWACWIVSDGTRVFYTNSEENAVWLAQKLNC